MTTQTTLQEEERFISALRSGYQGLFNRQWPAWIGGISLGFINILMFAYVKPWSAADGIRNWGEWFFKLVGVSNKLTHSPLLYSTSVINLSLIFGAFAAALLAGEFKVRMAPPWELFKGLAGGVLMGVGANLSFGCNIGGFFSATSALSLAGITMMIGLIIGAFIGLRYLLWEVDRLGVSLMDVGTVNTKNPNPSRGRKVQPLAGFGMLALAVILALTYDGLGYPARGGFLLFGVALGIIIQRTRFCFVRAFREPFMTGNAEMTKAVALAVMISVIGFAILKWTDLREWETFVFPGFWLGSLIGGIIFGIGMTISGGCASGSLWRAGEGHIKLWVSLVGFALSGALFRTFLENTSLIRKLGTEVFLPDFIGWNLALIAVVGLMVLWYLLAIWNEVKGKFAAI